MVLLETLALSESEGGLKVNQGVVRGLWGWFWKTFAVAFHWYLFRSCFKQDALTNELDDAPHSRKDSTSHTKISKKPPRLDCLNPASFNPASEHRHRERSTAWRRYAWEKVLLDARCRWCPWHTWLKSQRKERKRHALHCPGFNIVWPWMLGRNCGKFWDVATAVRVSDLPA